MKRELVEGYYDCNEQLILQSVEAKECIKKLDTDVENRLEEMQPFVELMGHEFWYKLDQVTTAQNALAVELAKEMYIRGFLDYERLVCGKEEWEL